MPAIAPPERPELDDAATKGVEVDEATKTVVVGAGLVDVCMTEEEEVWIEGWWVSLESGFLSRFTDSKPGLGCNTQNAGLGTYT